MAEYQRQTKAKTINIPIIDSEVKIALRQLRQPICLFGEDAMARRERLRKIAQETYIAEGRVPQLAKPKEKKEEKTSDEKELFYTHGSEELKKARMEIALFSIPRASLRYFLINNNYRLAIAKKKRAEKDRIAESNEYEKFISKFDKGFHVESSQYGDERCISKASLSPDESLLATAGWSGVCKIWGIPDCQLRTELKGHEDKVLTVNFHPMAGMGLSENGPNVATGSADSQIRLWSLNPELEFQQSIVLGKHDERVNCVVYHPLGHYLASSSDDKTWRLWDIELKKELFVQEGHEATIVPLTFQQDGSLIASGDFNGIGKVWDLRTGRSVLNLQGHVKRILAMSFLPNGYQIASGSDDNTIRIWDLRRKSSIQNLPAHHKPISDIRFDPNEGKYMVSASYDGVCKVWNTRDWQVVAKFAGHESKMTCALPMKDCEKIITTSTDRTFKIWSINKE